jgi:hypothetical protein
VLTNVYINPQPPQQDTHEKVVDPLEKVETKAEASSERPHKFLLLSQRPITHNVKVLRFVSADPAMEIPDVPIGHHLRVQYDDLWKVF